MQLLSIVMVIVSILGNLWTPPVGKTFKKVTWLLRMPRDVRLLSTSALALNTAVHLVLAAPPQSANSLSAAACFHTLGGSSLDPPCAQVSSVQVHCYYCCRSTP